MPAIKGTPTGAYAPEVAAEFAMRILVSDAPWEYLISAGALGEALAEALGEALALGEELGAAVPPQAARESMREVARSRDISFFISVPPKI
ncbi:hypothetical protein KL86CLO1_12662 [uncultured Eubacteriales bacterium]|uniref:Uncharacterized protein n=1 Tax=uncultured Eubacteriales bacterium TaxID=172733 RepID=A0A212KCR6_9FIRM|nr:hypothetical protein KL86CLO1_12662 [uncultured Eubacteriales bacterium]